MTGSRSHERRYKDQFTKRLQKAYFRLQWPDLFMSEAEHDDEEEWRPLTCLERGTVRKMPDQDTRHQVHSWGCFCRLAVRVSCIHRLTAICTDQGKKLFCFCIVHEVLAFSALSLSPPRPP